MYYVYQDKQNGEYFITSYISELYPYIKTFVNIEDAESFIDKEEKSNNLQRFKNYASVNVIDYRKVVEKLIKEFDNGNVETSNLIETLNNLIKEYTHNPTN